MSAELTIKADKLREEEPGYLLGRALVFGVPHHLEFYRLAKNPDGSDGHVVWQPSSGNRNWNDPRHEELLRLNDGVQQLVRVPGFEGEYVCCMFPYVD